MPLVKIPMVELTGHGATVHGEPILGVDVRLAHDLGRCGIHGSAALAQAATKILSRAVDAVDDGYPPGLLFYVLTHFVDSDGFNTMLIHAERVSHGFAVYYPTVVDDESA